MLSDAEQPGSPPLAVISRALGTATNNFAEYSAVILALRRARQLGAQEVELVLDSKLVVEQLSGRWKVRHPAIAPLVAQAQAELAGFRRWRVRHEPRAANHQADALANLALDDPAAARRAEAGETVTASTTSPSTTSPRATAVRATSVGAPDPIGQVVVGAACALFDGEGRVLLVRHSYGRRNWELPGGLAHPGEAPSVAAERELAEETGLRLRAARLASVYFESGHERGPALHFVFLFTAGDDLAPVARPPEIEELTWAPPDQLPRPISDFTARRIDDARRGTGTYGIVEGRRWLD